ncbi:Oidioi.mRNA.OKI2018_I69.chr1.g3150.t1.cds [Oikopleura dioica]|uniref:Oidioi.mRNA.OKI2018_I69.chr1.g3150.t1.cds n=1 Tax=Oikopleura dioica TaxID=34765 RepID=A0ABN7T039_OIKDI|nr:Oidioi.mRNA.OKI2018_I69.chr1.g3150.t1.cds [Oikopleura dioica]
MSGVKRDWYQSNERVILALLTKACSEVQVQFERDSVTVSGINKEGNAFTEVVELACEIVPKQSTFKTMSTKIELRLMKADPGLRWEQLEKQSLHEIKQPVKHNQTKDWDKLAKEAAEQEDKDIEQGGGDAALQQMFKKIYANANEDTKRAMMKSFQESNGTVLSTNWNEIGSKKTETKPPDSMEFKKWDS